MEFMICWFIMTYFTGTLYRDLLEMQKYRLVCKYAIYRDVSYQITEKLRYNNGNNTKTVWGDC